jgi:DNA-binding transcriptional MerR regulator
MGSDQVFLNESACAELAGVSLETIRRFRQYGLLQSTERNGEVLFSEREILSLFHVEKRNSSSSAAKVDSQLNPQVNAEPRTVEPKLEQRVVNASQEANNVATDGRSESESKPREPDLRVIPGGAQATGTPSGGVSAELAVVHVNSNAVEYQHVRELVEINKTLRESVQSLREERDWLRERLEKIESFSQREQMLLLSNSETIRTLILHKEPKRRGFLSMLALPLLKPFQKDKAAKES